MSLVLYLVGCLIMLGGLIWGAHLMSVPDRWIVILSAIVFGLCLAKGVTLTRSRDV